MGFPSPLQISANSLLKADVANTPTSLVMPANTIAARDSTGPIVAMTPARLGTILGITPSGQTVQSLASWNVQAATYDAINTWLTDLSGNGNNAVLHNADRLAYVPTDGPWVWHPGIVGNNQTIPDSASLSFSGDFGIEIDVYVPNWVPGATETFVSKFNGTAGNQRTLRWDLSALGFPILVVSGDGIASVSATSSAATGLAAGPHIMYVTWRQSDGRVQFWKADVQGGPYTQIGIDKNAVVASLFDSTSPVELGTFGVNGASQPATMGFYRCRIWSDLTQTNLVLDAKTNDPTFVPPYATYIEESANQATVTLNRATAGKKLTAVSQTGLLYGTNAYSEVANNSKLNFGATDSFSLVHVFKFQGNPAASQFLIGKKADLTTAVGYGIYLDSTGKLNGVISDGTHTPIITSAGALTSGTLYVVSLIRNIAGGTLGLVINGVAEPTVADTTTGTLTNTVPLRIGATSAGTNFADMFGIDHLLFPLALSTAQMVTLGNELVLNTTTASVPVVGSYTSASQTVFSAGVSSEIQPRVQLRVDGSWLISDGSYAPIRNFFESRTIGGTPSNGSERLFIGAGAGVGVNLYRNIGIGYAALKTGGDVQCRANVCVGTHAGEFYTAMELTAIGVNTAAASIDCFFLTALGAHSAESVLHGTSSTHVGDEAGSYMTNSTHNSLLGFYNYSTYLELLHGDIGHSPLAPARCTSMGDYGGYCGDQPVDGDNLNATTFGYNARGCGDFLTAVGSGTRVGATTQRASGGSAWGTDHTGAAAATLVQDEQMWGTILHTNTFHGLLKWASAGNTQLTIGAAGGAAAVPASPSIYLKVIGPDGTRYGIPGFVLS